MRKFSVLISAIAMEILLVGVFNYYNSIVQLTSYMGSPDWKSISLNKIRNDKSRTRNNKQIFFWIKQFNYINQSHYSKLAFSFCNQLPTQKRSWQAKLDSYSIFFCTLKSGCENSSHPIALLSNFACRESVSFETGYVNFLALIHTNNMQAMN